MKIEPLYLKKADVIKLQKRDLEIGRGNDGIVYKTGISNSDELYKLYFRKSKIGSEPCYLELVDEKDAVDNIYKAIDRQSYVKRTKLQKRPIYINNRFRGVVIHYHKRQIPIYFLKSCPLKIQIVVLKELLVSIEELLDNFIYPRDLALQPYTDYRTSNVLLSFSRKLTPNIIDIDGRSVIYTDDYNEDFYYTALNSYKNLVMQILFDIDIMKFSGSYENGSIFFNPTAYKDYYRSNLFVTYDTFSGDLYIPSYLINEVDIEKLLVSGSEYGLKEKEVNLLNEIVFAIYKELNKPKKRVLK